MLRMRSTLKERGLIERKDGARDQHGSGLVHRRHVHVEEKQLRIIEFQVVENVHSEEALLDSDVDGRVNKRSR